MIDIGDHAPEFTLPKAGGEAHNDIEPFELSTALGGGPIVLAFFPAAFTSGCTAEMCTFRDSMDRFEDLDAAVYGISVDLPPAQNVWIREENLNFPMLSDWNHDVIHDYGVVLHEMYGQFEAAQRSIFVLDETGRVTYRWVADEGKIDFGAVVDEVATAVEETADG